MTGLAIILVLYMFASFIYTEFIYTSISNKAKHTPIATDKSIIGIVNSILNDQGLNGVVNVDVSSQRDAPESFYVENSRTIELSDIEGTAQAVGAAIHECGHAIQYNKSDVMLKIIRVRDILKMLRLLDVISPLAVPFFAAFCTPLYIVFSIFMLKLIARVIMEFIVEADANIRAFSYVNKNMPNKADQIAVKKFLTACSLTYLSTLG